MKVNAAGLDLIKSFEGLRLKAYKCSAGVDTIGYGHTSAAGEPKVTPRMTITAAEAEDYHSVQIETLKMAQVDLVSAMTFNSPAEAIGVARAAHRAAHGGVELRRPQHDAKNRWQKRITALQHQPARKAKAPGALRPTAELCDHCGGIHSSCVKSGLTVHCLTPSKGSMAAA